ncbi:LysR family transcriptional regulator [Pantoea alhagi]|uniref:LysR family transcriptional regulator n=1 Tax=Pantoea alhagi TaxID=1891675 RepID=A0A1W6BB99_9GAMM|nr:LysR family transcriptional regulator [Pantoea alhagi]ARJ44358.1 LysR family transcriptional regulator [Pantoea alhagi]
MDKIDSMKAFIRVVEAGSFTRASEQLGLPKSTVTRLVQGLENSMATKLLNRTSRRLNLTEQGSIFYQGALKLLEQLNILESDTRTEAAGPKGKVRVEMPHALGCYHVIPRLLEFTEKFPGVQIEAGISNQTSDLIEDNYDCVIRIGNLYQESLIARTLGTLKMVTCASPDYLNRRGTPEHPGQLLQEHILVQISSPRSGRAFEHKVSRTGDEVQLWGKWVISVNDSVAAFSAAKAGLGIVTTYRFLAEECLEKGDLIELFPDWQHDEVPVHIAWPENRHLPAKTRVFIDWIRTTWDF